MQRTIEERFAVHLWAFQDPLVAMFSAASPFVRFSWEVHRPH